MNPVLDAGALVALERRDPRMVALADEVVRNRRPAFVPSSVIGQAWRGGGRQALLARLLKTRALRVDPLTGETGFAIGERLASSGQDDVVDAHVVLLARSVGGTVLTSDPDDIRSLDAEVLIETV